MPSTCSAMRCATCSTRGCGARVEAPHPGHHTPKGDTTHKNKQKLTPPSLPPPSPPTPKKETQRMKTNRNLLARLAPLAAGIAMAAAAGTAQAQAQAETPKYG